MFVWWFNLTLELLVLQREQEKGKKKEKKRERKKKKEKKSPLLIRLLLLPRIPPQLPADAVDPVFAAAAMGLDRGEGVATGADSDVVAGTELDALTAVEAGPRVRARVVGDADAQHDGVRQDDGAERERVRRGGGD